MAYRGGIEAFDTSLQDVRNNKSLMGGLTVFLAGEFVQTLPAVPQGSYADEFKACLISSCLWPEIRVLNLRLNMRVFLNNDLRAEEISDLFMMRCV